MGKRGPPKTPTVILKNRGSWRAKTRGGEPDFGTVKTLRRPSWLRKDAAKHWKEIVPHLEAIPGLLSKVDRLAIGMLCDSLAIYIKASKDIEKNGIVIDGRTNPATTVQQKAWMRFARLIREFGLSPASRAGLDVKTEEKSDADVSRFFKSG